MIAIGRDIAILVGICVAIWLLTLARGHWRQLERNRGELVYTVQVEDRAALRLMDALAANGLLNGVPKTYWVHKINDLYELRVVTHLGLIANPHIKEVLRLQYAAVCEAAFPGERAMVKLANQELQTFSLLIEPNTF